ncbi:hypothetical protein D9619_012796 [Psilocybe cf. subviscida]|uniref:Hemerythrin-like domain-containing protein n=1 Tax=Psilocybe cf. subviscida TaxID=2480587 RepID=A0A8H5AQT7_9AGAR|nr:hypothetical protein D9619_012796 [Psilocybe cf. subviscida]
MHNATRVTMFTAARRAALCPEVAGIQAHAISKIQRCGLAEHRGRTILEVVKDDHKMLFGSHDQYEKHWGFEGPLDRWSHQVTWTAASCHRGGDSLVPASGRRVNEFLYKAEGYRTNSPEHRSLLQAARDELWPHHTSEEEVEFPMLEKAIGDWDEIGAPNKPPYKTLAAFMAMPLDQLRDTFLTFPDDYDFQEANLKH